jgi:ABC-2 type transport system permease protein
MITNFPALFALGRLPPVWFAWGIAAPIIFGWIASRLWNSAIKQYASGGN